MRLQELQQLLAAYRAADAALHPGSPAQVLKPACQQPSSRMHAAIQTVEMADATP